MKRLPACHAVNVNTSQPRLLSGMGLSLAAHLAIGALIIGVSHRTETSAVPIVAIELVDSRDGQAIAAPVESAAGREGGSSAEPAAPPDHPTQSTDPDPIASDFGTIDAAESPHRNAGSAPPVIPPSNPLRAVAPEFPVAAEPPLPEQPLAGPTQSAAELAETSPGQPTTQTAMVPPPSPIWQPPLRKPSPPSPLVAEPPRSLEPPTGARESVSARPLEQGRAGEPSAPASLPVSQVQSGDRSAHPLISPPPRYPIVARRRGQQGRVLLRVLVSASGAPEDVQLVESSGTAALDDAAKDAVRQWRFHPAVRDGIAIGTRLDVPIRFRLEED